MRLLASQRASSGPRDAGDSRSQDAAAALVGISPDADAVGRARRFDARLHVSRAARRAVASLVTGRPDPALGLIVATDHGEQHALAGRLAEFARLMERDEPAPAEVFRAIAYFPAGRVLRSVAEKAGATGPAAVMPANLGQAQALASIWLAAGRAERVAVVAADAADDGSGADAEASLWLRDSPRPTSACPLAVIAHAEHVPAEDTPAEHARTDGTSCAVMAALVIDAVAPTPGPRTAQIVGSMLADAGETLFASVVLRDPGPPLDPSIRALASRLGLGEVFVLVGSPGATMTALALAQDLIALDRADQVVVCGSDLVGGALASALRLLRCTDRPSMRGGAIAVTLARRSNGHPTVERCWLGSPMVPAQPGIPIDLGDIGPVWAVPPPQEVVLSGLTSADLACARQLASRIWPSAAVSGRAGQRSVAADVLHIVACGKPTGVAAVHSLGGTGWCLMS